MNLASEIGKSLKGYLLVELQGAGVEATLMKLAKNNISLWDLERFDEKIQMKMYCHDFLRIKKVLQGTNRAQIKIIKKKGLPFLGQYFKQRMGLLVGFILFVLILSSAGSYIWSIEILGNEKVTSEEIASKLFELGVEVGKKAKKLDLKYIENEMLRTSPEFSWLALELSGTKLKVKLVEKLRLEMKESPHLYASTNGLVEEVITLKGEALVKAGDTVKQGELLIESKNGEKAAGIVRARVWYEAYGENPILLEEKYLTGRQASLFVLSFNGKKLFASKLAEITFPNYTLSREVKKLPFLAFVVEKTCYSEELVLSRYISSSTAKYLARDKGLRKILASLSQDSQVLSVREEEIKNTDGLMQIRLVVETRQNIALERGLNSIEDKRNSNFTNK